AHAPLRREDAQALKGAESPPLGAVDQQYCHLIGGGQHNGSLEATPPTKQLQPGNPLMGHTALRKPLPIQKPPPPGSPPALNPVRLRGARVGEGVPRGSGFLGRAVRLIVGHGFPSWIPAVSVVWCRS